MKTATRRAFAVLFVAIVSVAGCGPTGLDVLNCYAPAEVPDGALLYDCYAEVDCGCGESPQYLVETLAASNDGAALSCWQSELNRTVQSAALSSFGCKWTGTVYHTSPGGQPNDYEGDGA